MIASASSSVSFLFYNKGLNIFQLLNDAVMVSSMPVMLSLSMSLKKLLDIKNEQMVFLLTLLYLVNNSL